MDIFLVHQKQMTPVNPLLLRTDLILFNHVTLNVIVMHFLYLVHLV